MVDSVDQMPKCKGPPPKVAPPPASPATSPRVPGVLATAAIVGGVALLVRLCAMWQFQNSPIAALLYVDGESYDAWARQLAAGQWIGRDVFYQAPGYPYFLGVIYSVCGPHLGAVRVVQLLLGVVTAVLLAAAAQRLFGRVAGLAAGLMAALWPSFIHFDLSIQKTSLAVFLTALVAWLLVRLISVRTPSVAIGARSVSDGWPTAIMLGIVMGYLILVQEQAQSLVAVGCLWLMWQGWRTRRWRAAAATLLGVVVMLTPVLVRNYTVGGELHLTTSQLGPNFYIGNHPGAPGWYRGLRPDRGHPAYERQDATELAQADTGRDMTPGEVSSYWLKRAFTENARQPPGWLLLLAKKVALLVNWTEIGDGEDVYTAGDFVTVVQIANPVLHYGLLVPLAGLGLLWTWHRRNEHAPLLWMAGAYALTLVAFYVMARYRAPLTVFLLLFAGAAVGYARECWRSWRTPVIALPLVVISFLPLTDRDPIMAASYANMGTALMQRQADPRLAEGFFRQALRLAPDHHKAMNNLAIVLARQGRYEDAVQWSRRACELQPGFAEAHFNLGVSLMRLGRAVEAEQAFGKVLDLTPDYAPARRNLAGALAAQGRIDEAITAYEHLLRDLPDFPNGAEELAQLKAQQARP